MSRPDWPGGGGGVNLGQSIVVLSLLILLLLPSSIQEEIQKKEFRITEELEIGSLVGSIDARPGFTYSFNQDVRDFRIDARTGEIRSQARIDRETVNDGIFDLVVISSSPTYPIQVTIIVEDINDNPPTFPSSYTQLSFSESSPKGSRVILDVATDRDVGLNGKIKDYYISSGNEEGVFSLQVSENPASQNYYLYLETVGPLDTETKDNYLLNITAVDSGNPPLKGWMGLSITVLDINDNPPEFEKEEYLAVINETSPVGSFVIQVSAVDRDSGENSRVSYSLLPSLDGDSFNVDSDTGVITTSKPLTCTDNRCQVTLVASDHGIPKQVSQSTVRINLIDANDHSPQITFRYFPDQSAKFATVEENAKSGSLVAAISVTDKDKGINGRTSVEITTGNEFGHFRLDSRAADVHILRVDGQLDRESIREYNLTVVAYDAGNPPRTSSSYLIVNVNDINDHAPVFTSSLYTAVLSEAAPIGTFVSAPLAVDADSGVNSNIYYSIVAGNDNQWFEIQHQSGLITTRMSLDRELLEKVNLKISARDGGTNPRFADTTVQISILDVNDMTPTFGRESVEVTVSEHSPVGTKVVTLTATDGDKGANGTVIYKLEKTKGSQAFGMNPKTGILTVQQDIDREKVKEFPLVVTAEDLGQPALTSTVMVNVKISDINDNVPVFYPDKYFVVLQTDFPTEELIVQLRAIDADEGINSAVVYDIAEGESGSFRLEQSTGRLYLARPVSQLTDTRYKLMVSARDGKGRKSAKMAEVEILVDNDRLRYFSCSQELYNFNIAEDSGLSNANVGRRVGQVAFDSANLVDDLEYIITDGNENGVFSISPTDGVIKTSAAVDREMQGLYRMKVNAKSNQEALSAVCIVEVEVSDVNDNIPEVENINRIQVLEDVPINQIIQIISVKDLDIGVNADHEFRLKQPSDFFEVDRDSGAITLTRPLEESPVKEIKLAIEVKDQGSPQLATSFNLTIDVVDVNDHTPYFDQDKYELTVAEDMLINSKLYLLKATDADFGPNGKIDYSILSGDNSTFGIFPDGNVYLKMALDREMNDYYSLVVSASDNGSPQRSSTLTLTIHVSDVNDNTPKFTSPGYSFSVMENEGENIYIGKIHATDKDIGRNAELSYSLEENQQYFEVEEKTGFILTKTSLDRETLIMEFGTDTMSFEVVVTDNGLPKHSDSASVTVQVFDENDNVPEFTSSSYIVKISENHQPGKEVAKVFAVDHDLGKNGEISYSITGGDRTKHFAINSTSGAIFLQLPLDREDTSSYVLTVQAKDNGMPPQSSTATVKAIILDENDNKPRIINEDLVLTLPEDTNVGQEVFKFYAEDSDLGENAEIRFSMGDGGHHKSFRIDPFSGSLYLQKSLDYEKDTAFTLKVIASDQGQPQLTDMVTLKLKVTDVNDNAPKFPNTAIVRQIQEGIELDSPVLTIEARDADSGNNGRIEYSLAGYEAGSAEKFSIDPLTGVIRTVGNIDREEIDTYRFTVVATDMAEPTSQRMSSEKIITIIIEDINDNAPEFESVPVGVLNFGVQIGEKIVTVQASDLDTNSNGLVTYQLQQESFLFDVDHYSGEISLQNRPDRLDPVYELVVVASDEAVQSERKSSTATVTILGMEKEEAGPGFTEDVYSVRMEEESGEEVNLIQVALKDGAKGKLYILDIESEGGNHKNIFRIDSDTGEISTVANIDREKHGERFTINLIGISEANLVSRAKVIVYVEDLNDTPPKFQSSPLISFSENTLPGETVTTLQAFDSDTTGVVKFSLLEGDTTVFSVDENSGVITLVDTVDRETREVYQLVVRASDGVQFSDISLILTVSDENDNIPEFTNSIFSFDLYETSPKGTLVGKVAAVDRDTEQNALINYLMITEWGNEVFSLDPASGIFTLTSELDYEKNEHYIFVVSGADNGTPQLSSTVTVYINVKDINDNSPEFSSSSYSASVSEDVGVGESILDIVASDKDSGDNGKVQYSIIGEADEFFSVLENGTLVSRRPLDREQKSSFSFIVKAVDGGESGTGRNSATATVNLDLEDINDSVPTFTSPADGYVTENQPPNTVVMSVTTVDHDEGANADIEYFVTSSDSENFDIGRLDGILRTKVVLDREEKSMYSVTITAMDMGKPRLSTSMEIRIHVVDENDNTPVFSPKVYSTTVLENATVGQNILQTTAVDEDAGRNGDIRYTIVSGDKTRDFTIGEHSGVLRVNRQLDFERKNAYQLTIQAEDAGNPVKYDTASVSIYIEDVNDSPPVFRHSPYHARVIENQQDLPRYITRVEAEDPDNPPHNIIKYSLKETYGNKFSINSSTGDIFIHSSLDRETDSYYTIHVVAVDAGYPRLSSTGTLSVLVDDINDNSPEFERTHYVVDVLENQEELDEPIINVVAHDRDTGVNGEISYRLEGEGSQKFRIDPKDGHVYPSWVLDREERSHYDFKVIAKDRGEKVSLESEAKISVRIKDVNDNAPQVRNADSTVYISQDKNPGDFVYKFDGSDPDAGENSRLTYRISGNDASQFTLDADTGLVALKRPLNPVGTYNLDLEVSDHGQPNLMTKYRLKLVAADPVLFPAFSSASSQISVRENTLETQLPQLEGNGLTFQDVVYGIAAGNNQGIFSIDAKTGQLVMNKPLDFEQADEMDLYISAHESGKPEYKTFHKIEIKVLDENDNSPTFDSTVYVGKVTEETFPPVSVIRVMATDRDGPDNSRVRYSIKEDKHAEFFEINAGTGEISTTAKLDREMQEVFEFVVEAKDSGNPPQTGSTLIKVEVVDINDNPPRFTRILSINITEDMKVGSIIATVDTIDKDVGENANVTYKFSEDVSNTFTIDQFSGDIKLVSELDWEKKDEYLLKVVATDGAWRAETTVSISVQDVNDNVPQFEQEEYVFMISASSTNVAVIGRVIAEDLDDVGPNSRIVYALRESSDFFSIDSTSGEILTRRKLENHRATRTRTVENEYILQVIAEDSGEPPLSSTCNVKILLMDENVGKPEFVERDYTVAVPATFQPGDQIVQVEAVDKVDTGLNGKIEYKLEDTEDARFFSIDQTSGWISLKSSISFQMHSLKVTAYDKGVPSFSSKTDVRVMPSGDNLYAPEFSVTNTQIIVPENEPVGSVIIQLEAADKDNGINGMVRFGIVGGNDNNAFSIDEITGEIQIRKELDYDVENGFVLTVQARDLAYRPKASNATLSINLTDVNDNVPFFDQAEYDAYLEENQPAGTAVIKMKAVDIDSPRYAVIIYSILESNMLQYFSIDSKTGLITSAQSFDFEQVEQYTMHVSAKNPDREETNVTLLHIHITGFNEFFPRFQQPVFQFSVSESAVPQTPVGQIQALDQDSGPEGDIYYFLVGQSNDYGFLIDKNTGVIYVNEILDREYQNRFVLTVLAKNGGSIQGNDTDEAQVIIQVQDGNDPPVFRKPLYQTEITEDTSIGSVVVSVSAVDRDVRPRNSQFSYSILGGNDKDSFEIDPNVGTIRTSKYLDRERVAQYELIVGAIDNGSPPQTGSTQVVINVLDINDNPPFLDIFNRRGTLKENSAENTLVAKLQPTDEDLPPNGGPFTFNLIGGKHQNFFKVDKSSGDIRSVVSVDRELTPELEITVEISDSGSPPLSSKYPIIIDVLDENDNPSEPRLLRVTVQTLNGDFSGGVVAPVRPKDPDTTGNYDCKIKTGATNLFQIKEDCYLYTGRLMNVNNYNLTVIGNDGLHDSVTSQVFLTFDRFNDFARDVASVIRVPKSLDPPELAKVFKQISFHQSPLGEVQVLSIVKEENFTNFFVTFRSGPTYVDKEATNADLVTKLSFSNVLPGVNVDLGYDPCQVSPCQNNGACSSSITVKEETVIVEAEDIIFNSPKFVQKVKCECPTNFEGDNCELDSNPCQPDPCEAGGRCVQNGYNFQCQCPDFRTGIRCELEKTSSCNRNPCQNGGTCRESSLGAFFCLCRPGYQGNVCETSLDPCQPNPCKNGGECISKKPNYQCKCPDNFYGTHCEKSTFGFGELSFMKFPALDPNTNDISITFSTTKHNSLLIYNFGQQSGGRSDFLAIELLDGKVVFSFGGARTGITKISINKHVSNSRWYKVTATRNNRVASLSIEDCTESGEFCKLCKAGDEKCFAKDIGESGTLNFNGNPLFFGGVDDIQPLISRVGQVSSDDFIGCVKSLTINGQPMNLKTSFLESNRIMSTCPIPGSLCQSNSCTPGVCQEIRWNPVCQCETGVLSRDCHDSLTPVSLEFNGTITFQPSDIHRRSQLFKSSHPGIGQSLLNHQELGFSFRTESPEGLLFTVETVRSSEFTRVFIKEGKLVYESKKTDFPLINVTSTYEVIEGNWHHVRLIRGAGIVEVHLDDEKVGYNLEEDSVHNFLDPYLSNLVFGGKRNFYEKAFRGCLVNFTVNGELQAFHGDNRIFTNTTYKGTVNNNCLPGFLSVTAGSDPVNVGVVIVIVFFIILILAILGSFFAFKIKKQNYKQMQNRSANDSASMNQILNNKQTETFNRQQKKMTTSQKPDIIERQVVNESPLGGGGYSPRRDDLPDYSASMVMQEPDQPEHYDLENASSIAPSDIDIIYHYKDYRDGGRHARELNMDRWGKLNNKNSNSPIRLTSLSTNKLQSTPLARLSPSSELSHQTPRILTLQDISGKPLQSALLQAAQHGRHSQRSARNQMGNVSDSSGSDLNSSSRARRRRKKRAGGDERGANLQSGRNSSLVSTLDGVSVDSKKKGGNKFNDLLDTNTELLDDGDTSDSPSENDSFTCSEYDYDTPFNSSSKPVDSHTPGGMVFRKLNASDTEKSKGVEAALEGHGSLSTLNVSDDDLSGITSPSGPTSWEALLNWNPTFSTFLGVFKDIAELPDTHCDIRQSPLGDANIGDEEEEYI